MEFVTVDGRSILKLLFYWLISFGLSEKRRNKYCWVGLRFCLGEYYWVFAYRYIKFIAI